MREPVKDRKEAHALWLRFLRELWFGLRVVWPILAAILTVMLALGATVGLCEGWSVLETIYFTFVSGLTIGFGDFVPTRPITRILTIAIGMCGLLLTALLAALAVRAMSGVTDDRERR